MHSLAIRSHRAFRISISALLMVSGISISGNTVYPSRVRRDAALKMACICIS